MSNGRTSPRYTFGSYASGLEEPVTHFEMGASRPPNPLFLESIDFRTRDEIGQPIDINCNPEHVLSANDVVLVVKVQGVNYILCNDDIGKVPSQAENFGSECANFYKDFLSTPMDLDELGKYPKFIRVDDRTYLRGDQKKKEGDPPAAPAPAAPAPAAPAPAAPGGSGGTA